MNKFISAELNLPPRNEFVRNMQRAYNVSKKEARKEYRLLKRDEVYLNDTYQVNIKRIKWIDGIDDKLVHISIKRIDKQPIHDWRDLQDIKNQLLGKECEAIELYPAESRKVDTANQYHLWGINDSTYRFPVGYSERHVDYDSKMGVVQRAKS